MKEKDCLFCKIVSGEIPAARIYEDQDFLVILDAFPHVEGQTLIIPQNHLSSSFTKIPDNVLEQGITLSKKIGSALLKAFDAKRVVQVIEGLMIDHAHIKLYPVTDTEKFDLVTLQKKYPQRKEMLSQEESEKILKKITL